MLRMFGRRQSQVRTVVGADAVLFGISLPSDTVIHDISAKIHAVGNNYLVASRAHMSAVEMWILPVHDPDEVTSYDSLWDRLVPKDTDTQTLDLDTAASDTNTFYEAGMAEWGAMLDVGFRPERLYHRHRIHTMTNSAIFRFQDNQSPFAVQWISGFDFRIKIRRRLRVSQPSVLVLAAGAPDLLGTTGTAMAPLLESEWPQVKYAGNMLERAMMDLFGITEAGAETPWEEATDLLQKHLDPDPFEGTSGQWVSEAYDYYTEAMIDHSVVGSLEKLQVTTGR